MSTRRSNCSRPAHSFRHCCDVRRHPTLDPVVCGHVGPNVQPFSDKDVILADQKSRPRSLAHPRCEVSTQSELFRRQQASNYVKFHRSGRKRLRHPAVGELDLNFEGMELSSDTDLRINIYTTDPGSHTADGLTRSALGQSLPSRTSQTDPRAEPKDGTRCPCKLGHPRQRDGTPGAVRTGHEPCRRWPTSRRGRLSRLGTSGRWKVIPAAPASR
jgi:MmyB-like transcription regulator ligand binding domain